jgi:protein TonB
MPAPTAGFGRASPRERLTALAAVLSVQLGLALALLSGFDVRIDRQADAVERLIEVALPKPPPPPQSRPEHKAKRQASAAPKALPVPLGGSPGPKPVHLPPPLVPVVAVKPTPAPSGGGAGSGPAAGSGSGGTGYGDSSEGGTDLVQVAGAILPSDYPRDLRDRGVGGRVGILFTVGANGRVTRCSVTRSSGVPELDALTCRLIQQRFVYRPSTDAQGRPIADEVEGEHEWLARR